MHGPINIRLCKIISSSHVVSESTLLMFSDWVVASRHSPQNLAPARLSICQQANVCVSLDSPICTACCSLIPPNILAKISPQCGRTNIYIKICAVIRTLPAMWVWGYMQLLFMWVWGYVLLSLVCGEEVCLFVRIDSMLQNIFKSFTYIQIYIHTYVLIKNTYLNTDIHTHTSIRTYIHT